MSQLTFDGSLEGQAPTVHSSPMKESWYQGRTLSHSSISLYRTCPQKWKFRYVDKVPERPRSFFSFGKCVHAGLEYLLSNKEGPLPSVEELIATYKEGWLREGYETPAQERWFYQEGERILRGFYAKHQNDFKNVFQIEYKFLVQIEGVPITGFIDRIDQTKNGGLSLIDYKTGKAFDKSRVRNDPQLTLYQMASGELLGKTVETVTLYHLNSLTPLTVPAHSQTLVDQVKATIVEAAKGISEIKFEPKPDASGHCQWCDYVQICPAFAGKKLPSGAAGSAQEPMPKVADRYGQLDKKVKELISQRDAMAQTLLAHFKQTESGQLDGEHYSVRLTNGEGDEPTLDASPLDKEK